jgi:hypothetical protein
MMLELHTTQLLDAESLLRTFRCYHPRLIFPRLADDAGGRICSDTPRRKCGSGRSSRARGTGPGGYFSGCRRGASRSGIPDLHAEPIRNRVVTMYEGGIRKSIKDATMLEAVVCAPAEG